MTRGQIIRIATAAGAVLFILIGIFTRHWWSAEAHASRGDFAGLDITMDVGLRSVEACINGLCQQAEFTRVNPNGVGGLFRIASTLTFFGGILACVLLAAGVFVRETQNVEQIAMWGSTACGMVAPFALVTMFSFPSGGHSPIVEVTTSIGYSFFLTLAGSIAGAIAGRMRDTGGWDAGEYKPIVVAPQPSAPLAPPSGQTPASYEYGARIREATASAPAPRNLRDLARAGASSAPDAAVDSVRAALRFVARSIEIMPGAGMTVVLESGATRDLLWADVGRVVARRLPPDPPYEKTLVVDVVPASGPRTPVRLLPSTQANYAALAGGAAMSSTENLRKLGQEIARARPGVIEPHSEAFFDGGQPAAQFQAIKQFADYDGQYESPGPRSPVTTPGGRNP